MTLFDEAVDWVEDGSSTMLLFPAGCDLSSNTWETRPCYLLTRGVFSGKESSSLVGGPRLWVDIYEELGDMNGIAYYKIYGYRWLNWEWYKKLIFLEIYYFLDRAIERA